MKEMVRRITLKWQSYKYRFVPWIAFNLRNRTVRSVRDARLDKIITDDAIRNTYLTFFTALHDGYHGPGVKEPSHTRTPERGKISVQRKVCKEHPAMKETKEPESCQCQNLLPNQQTYSDLKSRLSCVVAADSSSDWKERGCAERKFLRSGQNCQHSKNKCEKNPWHLRSPLHLQHYSTAESENKDVFKISNSSISNDLSPLMPLSSNYFHEQSSEDDCASEQFETGALLQSISHYQGSHYSPNLSKCNTSIPQRSMSRGNRGRGTDDSACGNREEDGLQPASIMYRALGYAIERRKSNIEGGGTGVFVTKGVVPKGKVVALYPGTIYYPYEPILLQSIGNPFVFRCLDGVHVDGNDKKLSRMLFRSCAQRDRLGPYLLCDVSWLTDCPVNPMAVGQYVNNQHKGAAANVCYQEFDVPPDFPLHLRKYLPNVFYSTIPDEGNVGRSLRTIALVSVREIQCGEELLSSYFTLVH